MNAKSTKTTGTKTTTKGTLAKTQAKAAKRTAKIAAKHEAIRQAAVQTPPQTPAVNAIFKAAGLGQMTEALNAATTEQLEDALKLDCWTTKQRGRIEAAVQARLTPAPANEAAKTVAAVEKGDLAKGVEVLTAGKKKATAKAARPEGKMSGLDAAAKVLAESATPLNAKQIVEAMATKGYWSSTAATPHATIYAAMIIEIAKKGDQARFVKADRGLFTVTEAAKQAK